MNKVYLLLVSLFLFTGCVTYQAKAVKQKISKVDLSKEISQEDALTIAQNYVLTRKIPVYSLASSAQKVSFILASGQVIYVWQVKFSQKNIEHLFLPFTFEVDVNIKNGNIMHPERWQ